MPQPLSSPFRLGSLSLRNRVVMAPLTRDRAGAGNVPTPLMATYYAQRASFGLIITEATPVSPSGHGYPSTPGLYTAEQIAARTDPWDSSSVTRAQYIIAKARFLHVANLRSMTPFI